VHTVIARFHHLSRDPDDLEAELVRSGAVDARITGYTVALTFGPGSEEPIAKAARRVLDRIGATGIKIHRPKRQRPQVDAEVSSRDEMVAAEGVANLMAKIEMDVFGHP